jgi:HPt (histidine-containing phosphotransfer) domain-containing protein
MATVLDPEVVDQLRALVRAGNPDLLHRLQATFARDTPQRLRALRVALAAGDREAIDLNVHTLKGSAANLGAIRVVAVLEQIEGSPDGIDGPALEPMLATLEQHAAEAQAALALMAETG